MNKTLLLASVAILSLTGCGFGLTPNAVSCGNHVGMDVWVDGTGIDPNAGPDTGYITLADGGTQQTYAGAPYMTCGQAFKTIDQAIAIGNTQGFWEQKDETFNFLSGMRIEFIDSYTLQAVGEKWADGYTEDYLGVKESAIAYQDDQAANVDYNANPATAFIPANTWPSAVILVHEMTHMLQASGFLNLGDLNGETSSNGHCHWSTVYAPLYTNLGWAGRLSSFVDTCNKNALGQVMACSGSYCSYQDDTGAPSDVASVPVSK